MVEIRSAELIDASNIAALSSLVWLHTYSLDGIRQEISDYALQTFNSEYFKQQLNKIDTHYYLLLKNAHLIGFITVNLAQKCKQADGYEIQTLYVHPRFHGNGYGKKLLEYIRLKHGENFWLTTWHGNTPAINFYKHYGFKDVGETYFQLGDEQHETRVLAFSNE